MKEDKDISHNILKEEDFPDPADNNLDFNLFLKRENSSEDNNNKLIKGELSNKEKIFDKLNSLENQNNELVPEAVSLRNIHKTYLIGIEGIPALRGVSLKVKKGEFLTIFGTSGGGKTTMLNIIGTIDTPSRGDVKIFDKLIKSNTSDKELSNIRLNNIAFVFQSFNLFQNLNVLENVEMPMKIKGALSSKQIKDRALSLIEKVGLSNRLNHFPNQLSGGEQQRVTIARALVNNPDILLLDEPTGDLDTKNADIVMSILMELNLLQGITMIMVTHDVALKNYGQKIVKVIDGKIHHVTDVPLKDRIECIRQLYERLEKKMGIREGTQSSNLSRNLLDNTINTSNSDSLNNLIQNNKTVTRKIDDYPIKKFIKNKQNNINSIN
jgi:putative ABC transport system ATP-binding protein